MTPEGIKAAAARAKEYPPRMGHQWGFGKLENMQDIDLGWLPKATLREYG